MRGLVHDRGQPATSLSEADFSVTTCTMDSDTENSDSGSETEGPQRPSTDTPDVAPRAEKANGKKRQNYNVAFKTKSYHVRKSQLK